MLLCVGLPRGLFAYTNITRKTNVRESSSSGSVISAGFSLEISDPGKVSSLWLSSPFVLQVAKATMLIGDPSYFPKRMVRPTGRVARSICIMNHPFNGTNNAESTQIIIPGRQVHSKLSSALSAREFCVSSVRDAK